MDSSRIGIKLFLPNAHPHLEDVVPVFHSWIQQQALAGNLLIDVADYLHVPSGPGIVLVAHEANYSTDQADPGTGLLYQRKRTLPETTLDARLAHAFRDALSAAWLLEQDAKVGAAWKFDTRRIHLRIADKLHAPNTPATFASLKPDLTAFFAKLLGTPDFALEHYTDDRVTFEVRLTTKSAQSVETLLARVQD
jgi:hypothetical protein